MADAVSQRQQLKQSMDRPEETSGLSAAPPAPQSVESTALGRAPLLWGFDHPPPRPLPARAFVQQSDGASTDDRPSSPDLSPPAPLGAPAAEVSNPDDVFAAIDAEASSRSKSSDAEPPRAPTEIRPAGPVDIRELVLPVPTAAAPRDLGHTIPQRMFEPRFETASQPDFDGMQIERALRPDASPAQPPPLPSRNWGSIAKRVLKLAVWLVIAWLAVVLALIVAYRFVNPPASMLMLQNWITGEGMTQTWVPIEEISPNVVRAVLVSEDGRFCQHAGIDLDAIEEAIENTDGRTRGGSTISMQVVKNLFLWPSKSYVRKAIELPLTYFMELVWPKRRIMEVYLNIAEWGPGIFGVGAAAEYHFAKSARELSSREAARLAVSLPNPLVRNAGRPGPGLQRLANAIQVRMRLAPSSQFACVLSKSPY
ncbi:monofunctional biosynthetic peptidoglycan transglycosylase [Hyphomicrobium sp.]|uniref:monofunctional biosynthetic peptidoglycan transglycosylase n=1 Tax=Hyphomicrobium sp. TaxID=82 RepID=UPI000FAF3E0D|nr:monofunctional biosynthetic peptidoglycan transglycosylase [Hyphomicrobium sp.]RUO97238.1 MAG: monofunctional biosynthetic peptidoglycan transglycosylase [Hyphomicrobium sp.]